MRRTGSSPLARGLLPVRLRRSGPPRIIPARAGFTAAQTAGHTYDQDHPRSRGVYTTRRSRGPETRGSSPLARGLPMTVAVLESKDGIIPARAGFTSWRNSDRSPSGDHPRSRGVYSCRFLTPVTATGSSPLARGLQYKELNKNWQTVDHPRSRGVYPDVGAGPEDLEGSSPLARGLL